MTFETATWTPADVSEWLKTIGMEKYIEFFRDQQIDGGTLLTLIKEDMYCLAKVFDEIFTLKDALKLERHLAELKETSSLQNRQRSAQGFGQGSDQAVQSGQSGDPFNPTLVNDVAQSEETLPMSCEPKWNSGGFEETVRVMEEALPGYCWRYKSVDVLLKDLTLMNGAHKIAGAADRAFSANVSHCISPVEFYVQPAMILPTLKKLQDYLQDVYSESTTAVPQEDIFFGMPCVTQYKGDGEWYRAQIVDIVGTTEAPVRFVDYGNRQYCKFDELKPMRTEFGRLPPLALNCRINGVRERTLEQKVLDAFHNEIDNLGNELLVSVVSSSVDPLLVEIFNKYTKEDIGRKYLPKEPLCPKMPSLEAWKRKTKKREETSDENGDQAGTSTVEPKVFASDLDGFMGGDVVCDSSSSDDRVGHIKRTNKKLRKIRHQEQLMAQGKWPPKAPEDDERSRFVTLPNSDLSVQRRFRKQKKPLIGHVGVEIVHVVSTKEIYVRILAFEQDSDAVQQSLVEAYGNAENPLPSLPLEFVTVESACVIFDTDGDGLWHRCRTVEVGSDGVVLRDVDTGKRMPIISQSDYSRMKVLVRNLDLEQQPSAYYCRIDQLCERQPTETECRALQELLPVGVQIKAEFDRTREPWRIRILYPENEPNFAEYFEVELVKRGLWETIEQERRPCTAVSLWQQPKFVGVDSNSARNETKAKSPPVPAVGNEGPSKQTGRPSVRDPADRGYENDIEAVLCGSLTIAACSEEGNEVAAAAAAGSKRRRVPKRVDRDENGSVGEFTVDKKTYVEKWLENASEHSGESSYVQKTEAKKKSVAAMYKPDLRRSNRIKTDHAVQK